MPSLCSVAVRVPNSPLGFFLKSSLVTLPRYTSVKVIGALAMAGSETVSTV